MSSYRFLIIDDDRELNTLLTEYLSSFGHRLKSATTAREGLRYLKAEPPDLVILDLMLPDMNGLELCKKIRADSALPIVMLTARGAVTDRIVGLEVGADDYLPKPFEPRELVARLESVMRRVHQRMDQKQIRCGHLVLEPMTRRVIIAESHLELTSAEFDLLHILMTSRGLVLTREQILQRLRGADAIAFDRSIDMLISRLRHKLEDDPKAPRFIKTIRGTGYQFTG